VNFYTGAMSSRVRNPDTRVKIVDGLRAEPSTIQIIMQRVAMGDVSGVIIANELGYEHFMIEMEYEGSAHPIRSRVGWRASLGFADPREAKVRAVDELRGQLAEEQARAEAANDERDLWREFCLIWSAVARDMVRLADCERFPRHIVERDKRVMLLKQGTNAVASQFRQFPFDTTGALFKRDWFKDKIIKLHQVGPLMNMVRGWDLAAKKKKTAKRTAHVLMGMTMDLRIVVFGAGAERRSPGGVQDWIREYIDKDRSMGWDVRPSVPIDPGQAGESQIATFTKLIFQGVTFDATREEEDKRRRALPLAGQAEHGNVYLVDGPYIEELLSEWCEFPMGDLCDLVDAATRAYDCLVRLWDTGEDFTPVHIAG
jgi:predicted phage terminase large subunit-like protein